jgi:hypothetical protein
MPHVDAVLVLKSTRSNRQQVHLGYLIPSQGWRDGCSLSLRKRR